jgi:hypothetical protein
MELLMIFKSKKTKLAFIEEIQKEPKEALLRSVLDLYPNRSKPKSLKPSEFIRSLDSSHSRISLRR